MCFQFTGLNFKKTQRNTVKYLLTKLIPMGIIYLSESSHSSEAYRIYIKVAVVTAVSPTVRDLFQLKWKLRGLFFGAALFILEA